MPPDQRRRCDCGGLPHRISSSSPYPDKLDGHLLDRSPIAGAIISASTLAPAVEPWPVGLESLGKPLYRIGRRSVDATIAQNGNVAWN